MLIPGHAQKVLKVLHLLAASYWIGGGLALYIMTLAGSTAQNGAELLGMFKGLRFVNMVVVIWLGALGSVFTGLAYSLCTNRGFFRHKWIIIKWLVTVYLVLVGTLVLGPWGTYLLECVQQLGMDAFNDPTFIAIRNKYLRLEVLHMLLFVATIAISVFRPWEMTEIARRQKKFMPARREIIQ